MYRKSHGSYAPGEQKTRGYDWGKTDPTKVRFGRKGDTIAFNGVSSNITEVLQGGGDDLKNQRIVNLKQVKNFSLHKIIFMLRYKVIFNL